MASERGSAAPRQRGMPPRRGRAPRQRGSAACLLADGAHRGSAAARHASSPMARTACSIAPAVAAPRRHRPRSGPTPRFSSGGIFLSAGGPSITTDLDRRWWPPDLVRGSVITSRRAGVGLQSRRGAGDLSALRWQGRSRRHAQTGPRERARPDCDRRASADQTAEDARSLGHSQPSACANASSGI
jgi:hypothetical protein